MKLNHIFMLIILAVTVVGCNSTPRALEDTSIQSPMRLKFGDAESAKIPIRLRSGQVIVPPHCCPPLELRNMNGVVVQEIDATASKQRLVAPDGIYILVGHDPAGRECVQQLEITSE